ncbi:MAG TPA: allantoicase [Pyrinomonadaceae bacterium]
MLDFTGLIDLASERVGGAVLYANDDFFAPKENLLKASTPVFIEGKYTERGKWMDGWESRRRRTPGFDWCIIRLGLPGLIRGVVVDTAHFKGNFPESCSLEACAVEGTPDLEQLTDASIVWTEILPPSPLQGDSQNLFHLAATERFTHLRFKIYPDGGVARLRVYGEVVPEVARVAREARDIDLAAVEHGGLVVASSDMFFGHGHHLIMPGRARDMSDGWETRRRRGPGHDWIVIRLGLRGLIRRVEVDTSHFKGNFPESCSLEACDAEGLLVDESSVASLPWKEVLPRTRLQAHTRHTYVDAIKDAGAATHVRFHIYPDGGVARLRVYGSISEEED